MTASPLTPELARCVSGLAGDDPAVVTEAGAELAASVVGGGLAAADAVALAQSLTGALGSCTPRGQARAVLLLGILTEKGGPQVASDVSSALGSYLELLPAAAPPLRLALLYLLAHFPGHRDRIMSAVRAGVTEDEHGISRLDRILRRPDFTDPATADQAGRSWPSPAFLAVTDDEVRATAAARRALAADQVAASWEADTMALLAFSGGLAVAGGA